MAAYSSKEVGQLIKKYRLDQNMSQESLCKGICAISYLSKIESGLVLAGDDIIIALFKALNITYVTDETFLTEGQTLLESFFKAYFFQYFDECTRLFSLLYQDESKYLFSPLMLDYLLAKAYDASRQNPSMTLEIIQQLSPYLSTLSPHQNYFFSYIQGLSFTHFDKDYDRALQAITTANSIRQTASSLSLLAICHFYRGEYPMTIDLNEDAFKLAINDGNILCALSICLSQSAIYSNMKNTFLMLKYYNRALNLCEGIGDLYFKESIYYNLGATYLTLKDYKKALSYSLQSLALSQMNHSVSVSLYHKLALIYIELHDKEEARSYLSLAYDALKKDTASQQPSMKLALDLLAIRITDNQYLYNPDYLHLLEVIYESIKDEFHHGFKQFHGDYLIACYKANRRYKDALRITEELYVHTSCFLKHDL